MRVKYNMLYYINFYELGVNNKFRWIDSLMNTTKKYNLKFLVSAKVVLSSGNEKRLDIIIISVFL